MIPQPPTKRETDVRLPFLFILFALLSFLTAHGLLLFKTNAIIEGVFRSPIIWTSAHFLLLGFASMVAMGAMYQLVPVALLVPIWSVRLGFIQFVMTVVGIITLAIGFSFNLQSLAIGGSITVIGIILFLFQMAMTIPKQKEKNTITLFVSTALVCLLLTTILGLLLAIGLGAGITVFDHLVLLKSHILLGLAGWFTFLIIGFSYKLVPMFSLAHGFSMTLSRWVYIVYVIGLVIVIVSFLVNSHWLFSIGLFLLFVGFLLFLVHIRQLLKKRMKKRLDKGLTFSLIGITAGCVVYFSFVVASFLPDQYELYTRLIYLYIFVWITFSICGYLFKIVPFLWWTHKYSKKAGQKGVPLLKDLINERLAFVIFVAMTIAVFGIVVSFIVALPPVLYVSQGLFFVAVALFCIMVIAVVAK